MCLQERNIFINFNLFFQSRSVCRKTQGLRVRVNPILVFIKGQVSTTRTIAHCKSIGCCSMSPWLRAKTNSGSFRRASRPPNEEIFPRLLWYYGIRRDNIIRAAAPYLGMETENKFRLVPRLAMESSSICARDRKYYYDTYVIRLLYLDCEF